MGFTAHIDSLLPAPQHTGPSQALTLCLPQAESYICPSSSRAWAVQMAQSQRPGWGSVLCQAAGLWFVNGLHSWECEWGWAGVINCYRKTRVRISIEHFTGWIFSVSPPLSSPLTFLKTSEIEGMVDGGMGGGSRQKGKERQTWQAGGLENCALSSR